MREEFTTRLTRPAPAPATLAVALGEPATPLFPLPANHSHRPPCTRIPAPQLPILFSPIHLAFVPLLLLLARVAYVQAKHLLGSSKANSKHMSLVVKWGRERLHFSVPPPDSKLGELRKQIADYTQLPTGSFKLIHAGAVMKDDSAPISAYGIKRGSTIALVGGGDPIKPPSSKVSSAHAAKAPRTEESTISQIRSELDKVRVTLKPDVDTFLLALTPASAPAHVGPEPTVTVPAPKPASAAASGTGQPLDLEREHVRLGELLLQSLLRLDAIGAEGEWEVARRERKGAVKEVQGLLDRLDGGWRARVRS